MPVIPVASAADPRLADYALLGDPARLRAAGAFVAEGRFVVRRLVEGARFAVRSLLVTETALAALADLGSRLAAVPVLVASKPLLREVTGFAFHQGCLAIGERPGAEADLERWYVARFLELWEAAEHDPSSFYARFRHMTREQTDGLARMVWRDVNLKNLHDHIIHARARADLVVAKAGDHSIASVSRP